MISTQSTQRTLQVRSVRAEIDRREAAGQFVAGRGGEAGANPMRTPEERAERQKLIVRDIAANFAALYQQQQIGSGRVPVLAPAGCAHSVERARCDLLPTVLMPATLH